jgi:uroporphyrinogen decarboxylase
MTPRERILAAIDHERPDRTPLDGWFHPEIVERLKSHFHTEAWSRVEESLGVDGWVDLSPSLHNAHFDAQATPRPGRTDGLLAIWLDENTYEDAWGVQFRLGTDGRYRRWLHGPLENAKTVDEVLGYHFPTADCLREPEDYAGLVAAAKGQGKFVTAEIDNPYKRFWHLRGYENALMDYLADPEILESVYDRLYPTAVESAVRMARSGVDMIKIVGDVAMNDRIVMGPGPWRRFDKPRLARLIAACRAVNNDAAFFFHSDGKLTDLMDDLVEIGFTVINPIQPECMEPLDVKKRWGDRITLHGGISIQRTLPFGSVADVCREVHQLIQNCGMDGGLILMPSNVIQPDTPIENIIACYDAARRFAF